MDDIFVELPGQIEPFQTPFDQAGTPETPCRFIYMSNRKTGRYSGLLPIGFSLGMEIAKYFPMGYSQMWSLEKIACFHPLENNPVSVKPDKRRELRPTYPPGEKLDRLEWVNNLYIVLREPVCPDYSSDVFAVALKKERAIKRAEKYTKTYGRRSVVGFLIGDCAWH